MPADESARERFSRPALDELFRKFPERELTGARIEFISRQFLGIPYRADTLAGPAEAESLVLSLTEVDCFTLLDYVEAMRHASSFGGFLELLRRIRYREGLVSFTHRNHFFSDWAVYNSQFVGDVTAAVGRGRVRRITKSLNRKEDGSFFIPGILPVVREIIYIPSPLIDGGIVEKLQTGDYAGIYTDAPGLDVSHVGIIVRRDGDLVLRHASSSHGKVLDQDFRAYMEDRAGLILLRPRAATVSGA
ncbi:MAG: DUF1460 domain-containing protein [Nitrospiraceae bacterium]|nr:DUF1460 domain-containing protein [Nitrospiraceae bacterium]